VQVREHQGVQIGIDRAAEERVPGRVGHGIQGCLERSIELDLAARAAAVEPEMRGSFAVRAHGTERVDGAHFGQQGFYAVR
jgi:hypothetical protein